MRQLLKHIQTYVVRGFWAVIPLGISFFVIQLLYTFIDRRVTNLIDRLYGFSLPGLGILLVLLVLYFLGLGVSNVVGKKILGGIDYLSDRIPLVKTTYRVGKQLATSLSLSERQVFNRVVLVEYLKPGMWTIGFVTGTLVDRQRHGETLLKVYIPTPPNPTSGTVVVVRESETRDPGWSVEEGMRAVISAGIIGPEEIRLKQTA